MFISIVAKMLSKTPKLTPIVRFRGVLTQIWFPTRGNPILLRSENALHLRSAFLTPPDPQQKGAKPDNSLKLNGSGIHGQPSVADYNLR